MRNKRLVNNRKGFTLVEMLVALSISALLFVMAIPTIGALQGLLQKRKFEAYKDVVRSATKLYAKSYKEDLEADLVSGYKNNTEGDDQFANIELNELVKKRLIDDYNDKNITCQPTVSKVIKSGNKNKYCVMLRCNQDGKEIYTSLDSDDYCKVDFTAPKLTVTLYKGIEPDETLEKIDSTTKGGKKNEPNASGSFYEDTKWLNSNLTLMMKAEDGNLLNIKLKNGSGVVEAASGDGKDEFSYNIASSKQMNLKDWYVVATDTAGNTTKVYLNFGVDTEQPVCTFSDRGKTYANKDGVSIKANCTDNSSGIAFKTDNKTGITSDTFVYTVIDNAKNENSYTLPIIKTYVTRTKSCTAGKSCQAAGCQTYNSCATSACGIASYKTCQNAACGVATYKSCENKSCGVSKYKSCRNSSCSCDTYYSCSTSACGNATCTKASCCGSTSSLVKTGCSTYSGFASEKACTNKSTSCSKENASVRSGKCTYVKKGMYKATMCTCTKKTTTNTCTKSCCGYNTCRTSACGCQTRNSCRDSSCGVESYKSCRLEVCGVESYNSCTNAACGANYNTCANSACGCASYYRNTATCGCESFGEYGSYTQTDTCTEGNYNSNANYRQCTVAYYY